MRRVLIIAFMVLYAMSFLAQTTRTSSPTVFSGRIWPAMSGGDKFFYVSGFQQGVQMTALALATEQKDAVLRNNLPAGFSATDFVTELDALYKETENLNITVPLAYAHVAKKLQGLRTKDELEKDLIVLRQISTPK